MQFSPHEGKALVREREPGPEISALDQIDRGRLAATIDLDFEFDLVAFVKAGQTGTLDSADVHEGIGLAVFTRDEAEALGRVEELHGAVGPLTSRLALRRRGLAPRGNDHFADDRQIGRRNLAATIDQLERELLAFGQRRKTGILYGTDVHERIVATVFALDKAEALIRVEELHHAASFADNLRRRAATRSAKATARAAAAETIIAAESIVSTESVVSAESIISSAKTIVAAEPVAAVTAISSVKRHE